MDYLRARHRLFIAIIALSAGAILSSCEQSAAFEPTPARATVPTASASSGASSGDSGDLKRTSEGGNVTIAVAWDKAASLNEFVFSVVMDTHSVDLNGFDLSKLTVLRTDAGQSVVPVRWDPTGDSHHRSGKLAFPRKTDVGDLMGPQTKSIEVVVRDVAGIKERSFKWEVTS